MSGVRYLYWIFLLITMTCFSQGQNLLSNPSFEDTLSCPNAPSQITRAVNWSTPTTASPDYFNACCSVPGTAGVPNNGFGIQNSVSGVGYAGFYAYNTVHKDYKEYIQSPLSSQLISNRKYLVSFYVNLSDWSEYAVSRIGAFFSSAPIVSTSSLVLNYSPQIENSASNILADKNNWMFISDTLVSDGTEQYITIGNFRADSLSDTLFLGNIGGNTSAYYYIDDILVKDITGLGISTSKNIVMSVYPNPANDFLNIDCVSNDVHAGISDVLGNEIHQEIFSRTAHIDVSSLSPGIYIITLHINGQIVAEKFIKE